jgi:hypothetical protein
MGFNTRNTINFDGTTNIFTIPFPYLEQDDVVIILNGVVASGYTFLSSNTVQLGQSAASLAGSEVQITRQTTSDEAVVNLQAGSLDPNDINTGLLQVLYLYQELIDSLVQLTNSNFANLPTTLPNAAGVIWNNNGVLCIS